MRAGVVVPPVRQEIACRLACVSIHPTRGDELMNKTLEYF